MPEKLKKGWTRVAFGDVVQLCRDRSSNPAEEGFDRYVGLEHLEPGDLKIRRWGIIADGTTFTSVFRPGQVLFGKRRAYQRKVAVADFEGVCSGDIYVLESKIAHLLPELLPFICQTDGFFEHAVGTSAGSLSPRTNWASLASYDFDLPPLEEQSRIAEVLRAATNASQLHDDAAARAETSRESLLFMCFQGAHIGPLVYDERFGRYSPRLPLTPVGDLLTATQYGLSEPSNNSGSYRMLRMMDLADGLAINENLCSVDLSDDEFRRYRLEPGDVLFNRTNSHDLVGRTGVYRLEGDHVFASYLVRLKTNPTVLLPDYLCAFLNASLGRRQVMRFATRGVSQTNVNASNLRNVLIPLPKIDYQKEVVGYIDGLRSARMSLQRRACEAQTLATRIANGILGAT
jgi:type I restriction enzyme, S subunit